MMRAEMAKQFLGGAIAGAAVAIAGLTLWLLFAGCGVSNPTFMQPDGGRVQVDADQPTDADELADSGSTPDLTSTANDGGTQADAAEAAPDLFKPADLLPAPSDLACLPFVVNPTSEMPCAPGQEQNTKTGPSMCFRKTCGCANLNTCTDCYWSAWTAVSCPPF